MVSATLRSPKPCSAGERRALVVDRVKAKLHARETHAHLQHLSQEVILICLLKILLLDSFHSLSPPCDVLHGCS